MSQNVQFGVFDRDVLFNKEVLPGVLNIHYRKCSSGGSNGPKSLWIGPDQSFLVPRFSRPLSSDIALPFGYVATATSRNLDRHLLIG